MAGKQEVNVLIEPVFSMVIWWRMFNCAFVLRVLRAIDQNAKLILHLRRHCVTHFLSLFLLFTDCDSVRVCLLRLLFLCTTRWCGLNKDL